MSTTHVIHLRAVIALPLALAACACHQDMYDQPKLETFEATTLFPDGASARPLPEGVVFQGQLPLGDPQSTGRDAQGVLLSVPPLSVDAELLERGRQRFGIYCAPCHGYDGYGEGAIVRRGFPRPPSYHEERLRGVPIGHFFDVSTHGFGAMPAFNNRVSVRDRWAIAAYIRALQLSQYARPDELNEQDRARLAPPRTRAAADGTDEAP